MWGFESLLVRNFIEAKPPCSQSSLLIVYGNAESEALFSYIHEHYLMHVPLLAKPLCSYLEFALR